MKDCRSRAVQVLVSVPSLRVAKAISTALLQARLCACSQTLGPMTSHFHWQGQIQSAREWLLLLKARAADLNALEREVVRLHPYEVPEILALPILKGHAPYLSWLIEETRRTQKGALARSPESGKLA